MPIPEIDAKQIGTKLSTLFRVKELWDELFKVCHACVDIFPHILHAVRKQSEQKRGLFLEKKTRIFFLFF